MILFVDAYNLLKLIFSAAQIDQGKHLAVERELADFARSNGHVLFIIYDGGASAREEESRAGSFIKIFSGYSQTADDVIKQKVLGYPTENTLLISQDRALCAAIAQTGYHSMDPLDFYSYVQDRVKMGTTARKLHGPAVKLNPALRQPELDALMQEASLVPFYKESLPMAYGYLQSKKSKKEKKMHRIIKKL